VGSAQNARWVRLYDLISCILIELGLELQRCPASVPTHKTAIIAIR